MTTEIRDYDGEPHEVAEKAGNDLQALLEQSIATFDDFIWAARGAWLTSEYHLTGNMPKGEAFTFTKQGQQIADAQDELQEVLARVRVLTRAAAWNPKST